MHTDQKGFAHVGIVVIVIGVLLIGAIGWRVVTTMQSKNTQNTNSDIVKLTAEEQAQLKAVDGDIPPTSETTPSVATNQTTPSQPVNNTTNGAVPAQTPPAPAPTPAAPPATPPAPAPAPTVLRPTAEFCAQKGGASFTNVWFTGTGTYTYDGYAWEGGYSYSLPRVSKTETGTPLRNYDTMQLFDVVEYGTQPQWAICSDKSGYVMVYYTVPNSPYTFNALAEYGHLSLQKP